MKTSTIVFPIFNDTSVKICQVIVSILEICHITGTVYSYKYLKFVTMLRSKCHNLRHDKIQPYDSK